MEELMLCINVPQADEAYTRHINCKYNLIFV